MTAPQHKLKKDKTTSQNLASGALSYTTDYARAFKLEQVAVRASVSITETIRVYLDSAHGSNYDVLLREEELEAQSHFVFRPDGEANFQAGDEIRVECTNANGTGTVYATVKSSEILV